MSRSSSTSSAAVDFSLPPARCKIWTAYKKGAVVLAIRSGVLSRWDAYDRYMLSEEELSSWEVAFDQDGIAGLLLKRSSSALERVERDGFPEPAKELVPEASVRHSVGQDAIACLDCGYRRKLLKRHLMRAHQLTPDRYRERWGLKSDYPMVAPNYAARRSELAKTLGLGNWRRRIQNDRP
jgi:predicted transcriptional regulator